MTFIVLNDANRVVHKVSTVKTGTDGFPTAICSICGWSENADPPGARSEARALARLHAERPADWPVFHRGLASVIGGRRRNADYAAVYVDDCLGESVAWAVADGIGDREDSATAARIAAEIAVRAVFGHRLDPAGALLVARDEVLRQLDRETSDGDAVMVVAAARAGENGYSIAWTGDCRAYELRDGELIQLTTDHTQAEQLREQFRAAAVDDAPVPDWWTELDRLEHVVTSTVARATPDSIGRATTATTSTRLLLTSDGVHKAVPHDVLTHLAATTANPETAAHLIALAGPRHGGTDNSTALVIDPVPGL